MNRKFGDGTVKTKIGTQFLHYHITYKSSLQAVPLISKYNCLNYVYIYRHYISQLLR